MYVYIYIYTHLARERPPALATGGRRTSARWIYIYIYTHIYI